jgi:P4 family phage/plasmid primase-like protien
MSAVTKQVGDWHEAGLAAGAECKAAALDYLTRGWAAIPCCPPDHIGVRPEHARACQSHGKAPLVAWKQYQTTPPSERDIDNWWRAWPNANVWVALGPVSGIVRLDVDRGQGEEFLAALSGGEVPDTLEMVTGDGRGLFYRIPGGFTPAITHQHGTKIHEGLSLLGQGAGTVVPPSRHKSGRRYAWAPGRGPGEIEPALMPGWLMNAMRAEARRTVSTGKPNLPGERITEGGRNNRLTSLGGALRRQGADLATIEASLLAANDNLCDPPLHEGEVRAIARSVVRYEPDQRATEKAVVVAIANGKPHEANGHTFPARVEGRTVEVVKAPAAYPPPEKDEDWNDPNRLARTLLDRHRTDDGESKLLRFQDEFYVWNGAAYRPVGDGDFRARVGRHCREVFLSDMPERLRRYETAKKLKEEGAGEKGSGRLVKPTLYKVTPSVCASVELNLAGLVNREDDGTAPPLWLDGGGSVPAAEVIAAPNGLFTLDAIAAGSGAFSPPTPRFFTRNAISFPVPAVTNRPTNWLRCLGEWFNEDEASIAGLQEWFGYMLSTETAAQKILLIVGPKRSGKGTIVSVFMELIGAANVASTSFTSIAGQFGLEPLVGKRVAVMPDARLSSRTDTAPVVERMLSISGEDPQTINRKNRPEVTTRLGVRFFVTTNVTPKLPDESGAFASRFYVLHTPNSWYGKEDKKLKDKLRAELPGILKWAARGWVRLRDNGLTFTPNDAAARHCQELAELSSPIRAFVRDRCTVGPQQQVEFGKLFAAWVLWAETGKHPPGTSNVFARDLRIVLPQVTSREQRQPDGKRANVYCGIGLA